MYNVRVGDVRFNFDQKSLFEMLQPTLERTLETMAEMEVSQIMRAISVPVEVDPVTGRVTRSQPGEPPRMDEGVLFSNIGYDILSDPANTQITLVIHAERPPGPGDDPDAAVILEEGGWSNWGKYIQPRPFMMPAYLRLDESAAETIARTIQDFGQ